MTLKVYIDDSFDPVSGTYVLAGCISSQLLWEQFDVEWGRILPWGVINRHGNRHFHANEMAGQRPHNIPVFLTAIERYILGIVYVKINVFELKRALSRILLQGAIITDWEGYRRPFYIAFRCLMDAFHMHRPEMPLGDEPADFVFDVTHDERYIRASWTNYLANRSPDVRRFYGAPPRFNDDTIEIRLQAADFMAWWVRDCYINNRVDDIAHFNFPDFPRERPRPLLTFSITYNEDQLIRVLVKTALTQAPNRMVIVNPHFEHISELAPPSCHWT